MTGRIVQDGAIRMALLRSHEGEKVVKADTLGMFPRLPNYEASSSPRLWVRVACLPSDIPATSIELSLP